MANAGKLSVSNVHDFNGDGKSDILWWDNTPTTATPTPSNTVELYLDGTNNAVVLGTVNPNQYDFKGTGDLNGDGVTDILWQVKANIVVNGQTALTAGQLVEWQMDSAGHATAVAVTGNTAGFQVRAIGDYNGDNVADLLLQNNGPSAQFGVAPGGYVVWNLNSSGQATNSSFVSGNLTGRTVVGEGDYDASGTTDLLVTLGTAGANLAIANLSLNSSTNTYEAALTNVSPPLGLSSANVFRGDFTNGYGLDNPDGVRAAVTAVGDLNGDKTQDILYQYNDGVFTHEVAQNIRNDAQLSVIQIGIAHQISGTFEGPANVGNGAAEYTLTTTGDYDGNGTTDLMWENDFGSAGATDGQSAVFYWALTTSELPTSVFVGAATADWHLLA